MTTESDGDVAAGARWVASLGHRPSTQDSAVRWQIHYTNLLVLLSNMIQKQRLTSRSSILGRLGDDSLPFVAETAPVFGFRDDVFLADADVSDSWLIPLRPSAPLPVRDLD